MSEIWTFGSIGVAKKEADLNALAAHFTRQAQSLPDRIWAQGGDLTQLSEAAFLAAVTGRNVQSVGASVSVRAFLAPSITYDSGDIVGKVQILKKVGDAVKKAAEAIKAAWSKLVNWVFKGPLQKAADFFLYCFISKPVNAGIARKREKALAIIDFIAKACGATRETTLTTVAAAITQKHGKTPAQILNAASKSQIAGFGSITVAAAIAALSTLKEIISKVVAFFKKTKAETPEIDTTDAPDLNELEMPAGTPLSTAQTSAPSQENPAVLVPILTPEAKSDNNSTEVPGETMTQPKPTKVVIKKPQGETKSDNTTLMIGAAIAAFLILK